ncbi:MAG TPA: ABC-2 family transporter protein [Herpetosiphonaceae bacterium]|nr:ABC-2 family transporter protein [Herpetosiphonaceae bacterium]
MRALRYLRLVRVFAGASISAQLEYRTNFIVNLVGSLLTAGGALFGLFVLYGDGQPLGGWEYREALVVVGLYTLIQGFIGAFLTPNLNSIGEGVRTGTLDFTLLKPMDAQFLVSARNVNIFRLTDVAVGLGLITWAVARLPSATVPGTAAGSLLVLASLVMIYAVWFMLTTTAFWFVKVANLTDLFSSLFRAGQMPVSAFPPLVRMIFTFIIPIAFITTVPAEAIVGRATPGSALTALLVAGLLVVVSRWFWRFALRNYTSASS